MYTNSNVVVTGGSATYVAGDVHTHGSRSGFERLERHVATGALHNSGEVSDQPKCHPGTRVAILDHLIAWAATLTYTYPIIWLHGPAGAGKSAIQRTIAQILSQKGLLIGSFFFFRTAAGRNSSENFIATLVYQLARSIPPTRPHIEEAIAENPLIFSLSLWDQAQALIVSPILAVHEHDPIDASKSPRILIVDGLDECRDPDKQCEILQVLCRVLKSLPIPLALLIASRPEHHIRAAFDLDDLNKSSSRLSLDDSYEPDADIKKFLLDRFSAIQKNHPFRTCLPAPSSPWPSPSIVDRLVHKASGQFIYASTVDKFVSSSRHNPAKRLDIILGILEAGFLKPFEQLDLLYSTIFQIIDPADLPGTLRVLGVLLVQLNAPNRRPRFLEHLLELETGDIRHLLFDLESLLKVGEDHEPIHFFHASLPDYLFDKSRSGEFWIDAGMIYADLAQQVIRHFPTTRHDKDIGKFFLDNKSTFFIKATLTPELRQTIEIYNFAHPKEFLNILRPRLLREVRDSRFPDAENLYRIKLATYAKVIQPQILAYCQDTSSRYFFITAIMTLVPGQDLRHIFPLSCLPEHLHKKDGFRFLNEKQVDDFIQVMKEILHDPQGGCFIEENEHADISLYLMNIMTKNSRLHSGANKVLRLGGQASWGDVIASIFPRLLSISPIRHDLIEYIKNVELDPSYMKHTEIKKGIQEYILRSGGQIPEIRSFHPASEEKPEVEESDSEDEEGILLMRSPFANRRFEANSELVSMNIEVSSTSLNLTDDEGDEDADATNSPQEASDPILNCEEEAVPDMNIHELTHRERWWTRVFHHFRP